MSEALTISECHTQLEDTRAPAITMMSRVSFDFFDIEPVGVQMDQRSQVKQFTHFVSSASVARNQFGKMMFPRRYRCSPTLHGVLLPLSTRGSRIEGQWT